MPLPIDVVFARGQEIVALPGGQRITVRGGTHWPADDPIVKLRPELFTRDSRFGMLYTEAREEYDPATVPPLDDDVLESGDDRDSADDAEQATAAPGERRNVRRPRS